jgi:hypothetical protein
LIENGASEPVSIVEVLKHHQHDAMRETVGSSMCCNRPTPYFENGQSIVSRGSAQTTTATEAINTDFSFSRGNRTHAIEGWRTRMDGLL